MRWSLPLAFLLSLLPLGGLAVKPRKLRSRQCKQTNLAKSTNTTTQLYTLQDFYQGNSFLNDWDYYSQSDPTNGNVVYQTRGDAIQKGLAVVQNGVAILSVDATTRLSTGGNRASVRISSPKSYSSGLFIADFEAMPYGCSVWPAYWSVGPNWPNGGEIDIVEGVNTQATNQITLHTGPNCAIPGNSAGSGKLLSTNCVSNPSSNGGCSFLDTSTTSFGAGFQNAKGGVFAHLWNSKGISIWHFPRASIPKDITVRNPNPSQWGPPVATFPSTNCDIGSHFFEHALTLDTTICGDWAGPAYPGTGCPGTCAEAVANPANFKTAKWEINYISVYQ